LFAVFVDASNDCNQATFMIGGGTVTRDWVIKVTQFDCNDFDNGGKKNIKSYNYEIIIYILIKVLLDVYNTIMDSLV
jgi:hypothetical protein